MAEAFPIPIRKAGMQKYMIKVTIGEHAWSVKASGNLKTSHNGFAVGQALCAAGVTNIAPPVFRWDAAIVPQGTVLHFTASAFIEGVELSTLLNDPVLDDISLARGLIQLLTIYAGADTHVIGGKKFIHGDLHPRQILVNTTMKWTLLDFELSTYNDPSRKIYLESSKSPASQVEELGHFLDICIRNRPASSIKSAISKARSDYMRQLQPITITEFINRIAAAIP